MLGHRMARISYDDQAAAAYKGVREVPRDGSGRGARQSGGISDRRRA